MSKKSFSACFNPTLDIFRNHMCFCIVSRQLHLLLMFLDRGSRSTAMHSQIRRDRSITDYHTIRRRKLVQDWTKSTRNVCFYLNFLTFSFSIFLLMEATHYISITQTLRMNDRVVEINSWYTT